MSPKQSTFRPRRPSRTTVIVGTVVLALATGGTAYAAIPNSTTGMITGCYRTFQGNLRVIDAQAGQRCNLFESSTTQKSPVQCRTAAARCWSRSRTRMSWPASELSV